MVVLAGLCFMGIGARGADPAPLTVIHTFAPPRLESVGEATRVWVSGCDQSHQIGEPMLPFRTARVLLPPKSRVVGVSVEMPEPAVRLPGQWRVAHGRVPVRVPPQNAGSPAAVLKADPDATIYKADALYPAARVQLMSVQKLSGHPIAYIRIFPVQYMPASGQLFFAPKLELKLMLAAADDAVDDEPAMPVTRRATARIQLEIASLVDNPEVATDYAARSKATAGFAPGGCDYLLITKAAFVSTFEPLLDRKTAEGLVVQTSTIEEIAAGFPGRDLPEKIRNSIRFAYTNSGISYVLLGGDTSTVPCRYAYVNMNQPEAASLLPCDLYFACLDGSWNRDGDNRWGEPTDGEDGGDVDLMAEVFVGRAPVDTVAEAAAFVEKSVRYAAQGHRHPEQVLLTAGYLGYFSPDIHAQGADMFDPLLPYLEGFAVTWLDDRPQTTPQWDAGDAMMALNESPHVVLYNGHGDVDTMMRVSASEVAALTNADPFFAYSVGCNAGQFDNDMFSPDSIGEELVKQPRAGAFAAVLNSRLGWFDPVDEWKFSGEFQIHFFDQLLHASTLPQLGTANQRSKHAMIGHVESASSMMPYRWCYYEINLLGDPHAALQPIPVPPLRLTMTAATASTFRLEWLSTEDWVYSVYASTNAASGPFRLVQADLAATPPTNSYTQEVSGGSVQFFRVEARQMR